MLYPVLYEPRGDPELSPLSEQWQPLRLIWKETVGIPSFLSDAEVQVLPENTQPHYGELN